MLLLGALLANHKRRKAVALTQQTLASLQFTEQKFSRAFQLSPDALILSRKSDGLILDVNEGFGRIAGYRREDVLGQTTLGLGLWANPDDRQQMLEQIDSSHPLHDHRSAIVTAQGEIRQTEISTVVMSVSGEACLLAIVRDVTERLAMESSLRQAATVFENTTEGVIITDARARILAVNRSFTRITGFQPDEVLGQPVAVMSRQADDLELIDNVTQAMNTVGHWQGEAWSRRRNGELYASWINISKAFNPDGSLNHLVAVFSDITALKQTQASLDHQAHHDPLTNLPNRLLFESRLREALAAQSVDRAAGIGALMFIDLDRFKQINDSLGHHIGDVLLKSVSERIASVLREGDTVARHGGDEFIVLTPSLQSRDCVAELADRLLAVFKTSFLAENHEFFVSASIGISLFPEDGDDAQSLIKHADAAMYRAKGQGRNRYEFYTRELTADAHQRMQMENEIRRGLDRGEFSLHYQPKMHLATGNLMGVEALVRWNHPQLGPVDPSYFIPLAEETGLIVELGNQILHEALAQLAAWLEQGIDPVLLAVNVSGTQLIGRKLVDEIAKAIDTYGIPASKLELEITEDFIMNRNSDSISLLHELRAMGVSLSIDDFGTGYSSLNYLKELPLNTLKIDRSFVAGLPDGKKDLAISQTIIVLAHNLGMTVVAEGVETEGQKLLLKQQGCDAIQGFLVSPALPAQAFADQFLRNTA